MKIKVGPYRYTAIESALPSNEDSLYGLTDSQHQLIHIEKNLGPDARRDTYLHEVLHACAVIAGLQFSREEEERFVAGIAPTLLQVLRENPKFVELLLEK